jgi:outer membrane receptor protein involved in Fe transport
MIAKYLSATALATLTLLAAPASAQSTLPAGARSAPPAAEPGESADGTDAHNGEIIVTGSRIARPETSGVLFLGGQPTFTSTPDLCGPANIAAGQVPATRTANCRAAAIAGGFASDQTSAATFLANFTPSGSSLLGTYSGTPDLKPERGTSWTVGAILTPRFIPGLSLTADYIDLLLQDTITPTSLSKVVQTCYDSPTYPNSSPQVGINTCGLFSRDAQFQFANGFNVGFLNLGAIKIHALNLTGRYPVELGQGRLTLTGSAYHLITYRTSSGGQFATGDNDESAGTLARPKWKTQLSTLYSQGGFFGQLTWNVQSATRIFVSVLPATAEQYSLTRYPALQNVDLSFGADLNDRFRIQLNVKNLLDQTTAGYLGYVFADYYDQIGRRYTLGVTTKL